MIREALQYVAGLGKDSEAVQVIDLPKIEKVGVRQGATLTLHDPAPERRNIRLHGYEDLVRMLKDPVVSPEPEVYHEGGLKGGAISVLLGRKDRRDVLTVDMQISEAFAQLVEFAGAGTMTVPQAVQALRFKLGSAGSEGLALATLLKAVDFSRGQGTAVKTDHGRESLGQTIEAQVQQRSEIPEVVRFTVAMYANDAALREMSTVTISCGIYLDVQKAGIQIVPLGDELGIAVAYVQAQLGKRLREDVDGLPVFFGRPKVA